MELARLFATVGFKVEKEGLDAFRKELAAIKTETVEAAKAIGNLRNVMKGMNSELKKFNSGFEPDRINNWRKQVLASVNDFYRMQQKNAQTMVNANHWSDQFIANITKLHTALQGRQQQVMDYSNAIGHLAQNFFMLKQATAGIGRFRQVPSSVLSQAQGGTMRQPSHRGGGGSGGGEGSNQYIGYWGRASGIAKSGPAAFLRPMLPTGMGLFNAVAAGYGFKELVNTGREMMQLEMMLKTVSGSTEDFNSNLQFTQKISNDLGIDVQNLTEAYAKFYLAGKPLFSRDTMQEAYRGTQTYFRLLGMQPEKIKLANKAIEQMMNKQRVSAEELKGQLAEHATGALQFFAQAAAGGDVQKLFKMMEDGKVGVNDVVNAMKMMGEYANASPELQKMLKMSTAEQGRFENQMKMLSKAIMESGLDELLAEMFKTLTELVKILTPFIKSVLVLVKGLKMFAQALWEVKEAALVTAGVGGLGLLVVKLVAMGATLPTLFSSLRLMATLLAAVALPAVALGAAVAGIVFSLKSISDYWSGEDNWVHAMTLTLQIALAQWDYFALSLAVKWELLKRKFTVNPLGAANDFAGTVIHYGTTPLRGLGMIRDVLAEQIAEFRQANNINFTDATDMYKAPTKTPFMLQNHGQNVGNLNINIDVSKLPPSVMNDPERFGAAFGEAVSAQIPSFRGIPYRN